MILNHRLETGLSERVGDAPLPPGVTTETLAQSPRAIASLPEPLHSAVTAALSDAITTVFAVAIVVMGVAFVVSLTLKELPLRSFQPTPEAVPAAEAI
jgi:hypothetical protein